MGFQRFPHLLPRPAIHLQHRLQIRRGMPIVAVLVTGPLNQTGNLQKIDALLQEQVHDLFIGGHSGLRARCPLADQWHRPGPYRDIFGNPVPRNQADRWPPDSDVAKAWAMAKNGLPCRQATGKDATS